MACRQRKCSETQGFKRHRHSSTVKAVISPPILSLPHTHPLAQTRVSTWAPAWGPLRQLRRAATLTISTYAALWLEALCVSHAGTLLFAMCNVRTCTLAFDRFTVQYWHFEPLLDLHYAKKGRSHTRVMPLRVKFSARGVGAHRRLTHTPQLIVKSYLRSVTSCLCCVIHTGS